MDLYGKILLGKNRSGGVYEGSFVVPGGGLEDGESKLGALKREMLEETGIDVTNAQIVMLNKSAGKHEKTLEETGERVLVSMNFQDYKITLPDTASEVRVRAGSDWAEPQWFTREELQTLDLSPPVQNTLLKIGMLVD